MQNLASKLPPSPNIFTESNVASCYDNIKFKYLNFEFSGPSPKKMLNILKGVNTSKAAGIENVFGKFLKEGSDALGRPISQFLCNLFMKLNLFPRSCKIAKVKQLFKKFYRNDPQNYRPISLLPILPKIIERIIFITKYKKFPAETTFSTDFYLVSKKSIPLTLASDI